MQCTQQPPLLLNIEEKFRAALDHCRCDDRQEVGELGAEIGAISEVLTLSFTKPLSSPPETEPFSQKMHLKIPLSSRGLKLSNSKPGCEVSAHNFFVK